MKKLLAIFLVVGLAPLLAMQPTPQKTPPPGSPNTSPEEVRKLARLQRQDQERRNKQQRQSERDKKASRLSQPPDQE